ncbi:MAG: Hpt domain-containing protein [Eggerthellaceae bacterium]|nr:Hpt domain-containing protein [Eggerthellaceae bacterium]
MAQTLADELMSYGIDYIDAMDRFGNNVELYERLALKYLSDTHYADLVAAMEVKDYSTAYAAAHSLKGVAGNLSFIPLYKQATIISDALYQGEHGAAQEHMPVLEEEQRRVVEGLEALRNGDLSLTPNS